MNLLQVDRDYIGMQNSYRLYKYINYMIDINKKIFFQ